MALNSLAKMRQKMGNQLHDVRLKIGMVSLITVFIVALLFANALPALAADPPYTNWQEYPTNPVFDPTERAYYPSILFDGAVYRMWYDDGSGTRYTTSSDGINWAAGTVVTGLTNGRHVLVEQVGSKYMAWYWDSSQLYSINDLRCAESTDGISWTSDAAITQAGTTVIAGSPGVNWNAGSYGPCDVFYNSSGSATIVSPVDAATVWQNKFVMYYDGTTGALEDIGLAVSANGKFWEGYNGGAAPVLAHGTSGAWDDGFATFCTVLKIGSTYHMWYSGGQAESNEGIGYAQSTDGISWSKYSSNPILHRNDGIPWRATRTYTPRVVYDSGGFSGYGDNAPLKMWYAGRDAGGNYTLGYAKIPAAAPAPPTTVGGQVYSVNKIVVLAPYLILIFIITAIITMERHLLRNLLLIRVNDKKL
jgi:hypothetical protein